MTDTEYLNITNYAGILGAFTVVQDYVKSQSDWKLNLYFDSDAYPTYNDDYCTWMARLGVLCHSPLCKGVFISSHDTRTQYWRPFLEGLIGKTSPFEFTFVNPAEGSECTDFLWKVNEDDQEVDDGDSSGIEINIETRCFDYICRLIAEDFMVALRLIGGIPDVEKLSRAFAAQSSIRNLEIHVDKPEDGAIFEFLNGLNHLIITSRFNETTEKLVQFDEHVFDPLVNGFARGNFWNLQSIVFVGGSLCPPFDPHTHRVQTRTGIPDLYPMIDTEDEKVLTDKDLVDFESRCRKSAESGSWTHLEPAEHWKRFCDHLATSNVKTFALMNSRFDVDLATCLNDGCGDGAITNIVGKDLKKRCYTRCCGHAAHTPYLFQRLLDTPYSPLRNIHLQMSASIWNPLATSVACGFIRRYDCRSFTYLNNSPLNFDKDLAVGEKIGFDWMPAHRVLPFSVRDKSTVWICGKSLTDTTVEDTKEIWSNLKADTDRVLEDVYEFDNQSTLPLVIFNDIGKPSDSLLMKYVRSAKCHGMKEVTACLRKLYWKETAFLPDVVITVKTRDNPLTEFKLHKEILERRSGYFSCEEPAPSGSDNGIHIDLSDFSIRMVKRYFEFVYYGEPPFGELVIMTEDDLIGLLGLAHFFKQPDLKSEVEFALLDALGRSRFDKRVIERIHAAALKYESPFVAEICNESMTPNSADVKRPRLG